ncbi:MAG: AgmX/PglI C-terminal domain-containing protein, partial [Polyangiales bacterium]
LTACYEPELAKQPALQGQVMTQFLISPKGTILQAAASGLPVVAPCIAEKVKAVAFPAPKGGGVVQVNFQVTFRPKGT